MKKSELAAQFKAYYALFKSTLKNEAESPFEEVDDKYLRIDFVHYGSPRFKNGGWVQMHARTYIQPVGSKEKYYLVGINNMPIAPDKHCYKSQGEMLVYFIHVIPIFIANYGLIN